MFNLDKIDFATGLKCKYCETTIPFFATAAVYGMIFLFGREHGYFGLVCPNCQKTNLSKGTRENVESIKAIINGLGRQNGIMDMLSYYPNPGRFWKDFEGSLKNNLTVSYIPMADVRKSFFSLKDHVRFLVYDDTYNEETPGAYLSYQAGDIVLGPVLGIHWFREDAVERLVDEENQSGERSIPRYVFHDDFIESVEQFCWDHHTILDLYQWQASILGEEFITYDNFLTRNEYARNSDFLDIICGRLDFLDQKRAVFPSLLCNLMEQFDDNSEQVFVSPEEYDEIQVSGRCLKPKEMAEKIWTAFKKESFHEKLSILSKRFILEYTDIAEKTIFSKKNAMDLRFKYLKEAYEGIRSSKKWFSIYRQVPRVEKEKVQEAESLFPGTKIISNDSAINHIKIELVKFARLREHKIDFLLMGETGTGKELFARAIHDASGRKGEFVPVNCTAIPANLFDSLLFGHRKGAFTGAEENSKGYFGQADGGTIFLDEIGELALESQPKILRVIQEGEIQPVGSSRPKKIDVRIVFATNRDLPDMVLKGEFREDLYERIKAFQFIIPPLSKRRDDIPILIDYFVTKYDIARKTNPNLETFQFSEECMQVLTEYHWNGNVRELENAIKKIVIGRIADEDRREINLADLPQYILEGDAQKQSQQISRNNLKKSVSDDELLCLERMKYNRTDVAKMLGYSRSHISRRYSNIKRRAGAS